jgi:hypothetical protein
VWCHAGSGWLILIIAIDSDTNVGNNIPGKNISGKNIPLKNIPGKNIM